MTFPAYPCSRCYATNSRPLLISLPDVPHIRPSKANGTSRRLSSLRVRLNTATASCTWQRAGHHWIFAGAVSYPLRHQPLPLPEMRQAGTSFPVCVNLNLYHCLRHPKLSKAIADAGWSELVRQLQYKGKWAGRSVVAIDQYFPSSRRCSCCGFTMQKMPLNVRKWHCPECGADHDRDINAARNIKAAGLAVLAHGEPVNPEPQHAA